MKKELANQKTTFIEWISVYDQLPSDASYVLVLLKGDDQPKTARFLPEKGWLVDTRTCDIPSVLFWSRYNLPK